MQPFFYSLFAVLTFITVFTIAHWTLTGSMLSFILALIDTCLVMNMAFDRENLSTN